MNVRLQYRVEFLGGVYINNQLELNRYDVNFGLLTATSDTNQVAVAVERLRVFVHGFLENTVFIHQDNQGVADLFSMLGINVTTLPEDPVDQIVGMMLYCKLNSIMEGRVQVMSVDIMSELGDNVCYQLDHEDQFDMFDDNGWWHQPNTRHNNLESVSTDKNIVRVPLHGWNEVDLVWPEADTANPPSNVVYGKFQKHDTGSSGSDSTE